MNNDLMIRESGAISTLTDKQRKELFDKYILSGDVSGFSPAEVVSIVVSLCERHGFDPLQRPFDVFELPAKGDTQAKKIIYANATASAMIGARDGISKQIVTRQMLGDMYAVTVRVTGKSGRFVEADGVVAISGTRRDGSSYKLSGDALGNKMMHCTTKAQRRATLQFGGLGMLDESEIEDIEDAVIAEPVPYAMIVDCHAEAVADWTASLEGCDDCDALTKLQLSIQKQPDAVREALKEPKKQAMERINCVWRGGKFYPNEVQRETAEASASLINGNSSPHSNHSATR